MRRKQLTRLVLFTLIAILAATVTPAEEIVHFTNGTTMAIVSHLVEDGMIHVDLGGNGLIAFPMSQVERVTEAGIDVLLPKSFMPANMSSGGELGGGVHTKTAGFQTGGIVRGSDTAGGSAFSRASRSGETPSLESLIGMAAAANARPAGNGSVRVAPSDHPNRGARQIRAVGRTDAYRGAAVQTGSLDSLGRTINGEAKLMLPQLAGRMAKGTDVLRFGPSEQAAAAAVAEGQPLNSPPPPADSASSGSDQ